MGDAAVEVAVIGAGPAGSTLAALLAERGVEVALYDRDAFPRDKLCGEFLSYDALPVLEPLGALDAIDRAGAPRISHCRIVGANRTYELVFPHEARGVSRLFFDDLLVRTAVARGATLLDLTESNLTKWEGAKVVHPGNVNGNYIYYGVREFGMSAVMNGIVLHGGLIPFGGTFLTFSDYARNAIRMAALMQIGTIFVYTHDSIGLGEDGPTHQSVEHVSSLRIIPHLETWRPADLLETAVAWKEAIERRNGPTAMALTRQNTDVLRHGADHAANIARGGYVLWEPPAAPKALIIATGSEVGLALKAAQKATETGHPVRVVSMPCVERFMKQDAKYREQVLPAKLAARLAIEAGISWYWRPLVGPQGDVLGVDRYGESAPAPAVFKLLGFTVENVLEKLAKLLERL